MALCKICLKSEANQTGSHILPWFLIRDSINNIGKRRRHNEVSFEISTGSFVSTYFGSEVLPDDIHRIKGVELTDEEIENLQNAENPWTRDNILCSSCEGRLSVLEGVISESVFKKLREYIASEEKRWDLITFNNKEIIRLFIYSLAWRASLVRFGDFKMEENHEEILRQILDTTLDHSEIDLTKKSKANSIKICELPLILTFFETKGGNTNSIFCSQINKPYSMIVNDISFQLFFKASHSKQLDHSFFKINRLIPTRKCTNLNEETFLICVLNDRRRKLVFDTLYAFVAEKIMDKGIAIFKYGFKMYFKKAPPHGLVEYFKFLVSHGKKKNIEYLSPQHFRNIAGDVYSEYKAAIMLHLVNKQRNMYSQF